jgi:acyl carrier protein
MEISDQAFDLVRQCLKVALELDQADVQRIDMNTTAADLDKWDSLGHLKLIMELERCFEIELDDDQVVKLGSVATIIQAVENKTR